MGLPVPHPLRSKGWGMASLVADSVLPTPSSCPSVMSKALTIQAEYQPLLAAHGLRDLPAFFEWQEGERLDKPGLETWRR